MRILTPKHSALAGVIVAAACLLAGGVMLANGTYPGRCAASSPAQCSTSDGQRGRYHRGSGERAHRCQPGLFSTPSRACRGAVEAPAMDVPHSQDDPGGQPGPQAGRQWHAGTMRALRSGHVSGHRRYFFQHLPGVLILKRTSSPGCR